MPHSCHATDCMNIIPPEMFMCRPHWFKLPRIIRNRILATYRNGQCDDMNPSNEYCIAAKEAVVFISKKENIIPDTKLYDLFLRRD